MAWKCFRLWSQWGPTDLERRFFSTVSKIRLNTRRIIGKSCYTFCCLWLFAAIRFVLSDLFQNLRAEDRQALLHVSLSLIRKLPTCKSACWAHSGKFSFFRLTFATFISCVNFNLSCSGIQEGAGHQVNSAFVELVFDNQDNRIPVSVCRS